MKINNLANPVLDRVRSRPPTSNCPTLVDISVEGFSRSFVDYAISIC